MMGGELVNIPSMGDVMECTGALTMAVMLYV
jgi:hypothetical protein